MKLYISQADDPAAIADGEPAGRKRLLVVNYDDEDLTFDTSSLSPFTVIAVDESVPGNKALMFDLKQKGNLLGLPAGQPQRLPKYYWDGSHLFARGGWAPSVGLPPSTYTPSTDVQQSMLTLRTLLAIYTDIQALTATQKTNIANDLLSGTPKKYLTDAGRNAAAIAALDWAVTDSGATGTALANAKLRVGAMYVQDNPTYLVNPSFDTSINVSGWAPVP